MMNIRQAERRDTPSLLALLSEVLEIHHEIRPDIFKSGATKYSESELYAIIEDKETPIFVAEIDARVVGYCFCVITEQEENAILKRRKDLYIDDLCIDKEMRGSGVGKALYLHAEEYAKGIGCQSVTLNVWGGNDGAIAFYEKLGLTPRKTYLEKII